MLMDNIREEIWEDLKQYFMEDIKENIWDGVKDVLAEEVQECNYYWWY